MSHGTRKVAAIPQQKRTAEQRAAAYAIAELKRRNATAECADADDDDTAELNHCGNIIRKILSTR